MKKAILIAFTLSFYLLAQSQVNLNQGLVAYYPFTGNANDAVGSHNGMLLNGPVLTSDRFGNPNSAYFFDGIDDFIQIANAADLNPGNAMTITAIFNPFRNGVQTIIGKIGYNIGLGTQFQMAMDFSLYPGVLFGVNPSTSDCSGVPLNASYVSTGGGLLITNRWYCVVCTFDNGVLKIYLDGVLMQTLNTGFTTLSTCNNADIQIGSWWQNDLQRFNGIIDDIRIYNRALNDQEAAALCSQTNVFCSGSLGDPVVNITFGAGANPGNSLPNIQPGASTTLSYVPVTGNPASPTPIDGQYTITNNVPQNTAWFSGMPDHTPNDNGGYMAFYNSQETPGLEFYRQTVNNLCGSTTYEFAAWIANCLNPQLLDGVDPNITFRIEKTDGTLLGSYNTGPISESNVFTWKQYGFLFTLPAGESSVVLKMINNSVGGTAQPGNDLAIDDITFRPCGPTLTASFSNSQPVDSLRVCAGSAVTMYGNLSAGYNTPNYRWQVSTDQGQSWTDVAASSTFQYGLTAPNVGAVTHYLYRMIAGEGNNVDETLCRVRSNQIVLTVVPDAICNPKGTPISGVINSYGEVVGIDKCTNALLMTDASAFKAGDTVLLIQMKGAIIDSSNTSAFGTILNYRNAGNYEYNIVNQVSGNSVILSNTILRTYDFPGSAVQLVRIPYYQTATIVDKLTSLPWNGKVGGILAFDVRDTLILAADMDVTGKGFSGGKAVNTILLQSNCSQNEFVYPDGSFLAAPKGESITSLSVPYRNGKGAPASGGGGGLDHNSGGGGGGNGGSGGYGGYQLEACTMGTFDNRGIGGKPLVYSNSANRIFMGGGGGAGHCNQPSGINMDGGAGGGIILVRSNVVAGFGNNISAKGAAAIQCNLPNLDNCHDGSGGGGGGGAILLQVNNYLSQTFTNTTGGKGGDLIIFNTVGAGRIGPGGGGGAGITWLTNGAQPAQVTSIQTGGLNGVITKDNNNPWGATAGQDGQVLYGLQIPVASVPFVKNITSTQASGLLTACRTLQFTGNVQIQRDAISNYTWVFGDGNSTDATSTLITHQYARAGQYQVKLIATDINGCKDSTLINVRVDTAKADAGTDQTVCSNQATTLQGSGGGNYSWTPASLLSNPSVAQPIATVSGSTKFYLTVSDTSLCTATDSVMINVIPKPLFTAPNASIQACAGKPVQLLGNNGGSVDYSWSPSTYLDNSTSQNPVFTPGVTSTLSVKITERTCLYDTTFQLMVTVNDTPVVAASRSNDIDCSNPTAVLTATGAETYTWTPASSLNNPNSANPVASPTTTQQYKVTGRDNNGCESSDTITVKVTNGGNIVFLVPNAFTPNGDGRNDCFGIQRWGNVNIKEFSIFNRWGQRVFTTKDPTQCWDGRVNGKMQDPGGYVYVISASTFCGEIKRTGNLLLIR